MAKAKVFVIDFETRSAKEDLEKNETSVWLWDICSCADFSHKHGTTLDTCLEYLSTLGSATVYSHNLKFDGKFILCYLIEKGFVYDDKLKDKNTFNTCVDDMLVFYSIKVCLKTKKGLRIVEFRDSTKKIQGTVEDIAIAYKLPILKGKIDYKMYRPLGYEPTEEEITYIEHDTEIVARVLKDQYAEGMTHITSASDSFNLYKTYLGKTTFKQLYPVVDIETDNYFRKAYRGGVVICNPKFKNQVLYNVKAYDVNSMYPAVMSLDLLPYGMPVYHTGKPVKTEDYPLYICHFEACISIKKGYMPTVQSHNSFMGKLEYITDTEGQMHDFYMSNVDFELMVKHYDILDIKYISYYSFHGSRNLFKEYILPIYEEKKHSTGAKKQNAKIKLNSLYGKFAMSPVHINKMPFLDKDNDLCFMTLEETQSDPIYTAMAVFITSNAHKRLFDMIDPNVENFAYCDTDSVHIVGDTYNDLWIDQNELGACKIEHDFETVKYIGTKAYIGFERTDKGLQKLVKCAGLTDLGKLEATMENFKVGAVYGGKLRPKAVKGGVILVETNYTIKER